MTTRSSFRMVATCHAKRDRPRIEFWNCRKPLRVRVGWVWRGWRRRLGTAIHRDDRARGRGRVVVRPGRGPGLLGGEEAAAWRCCPPARPTPSSPPRTRAGCQDDRGGGGRAGCRPDRYWDRRRARWSPPSAATSHPSAPTHSPDRRGLGGRSQRARRSRRHGDPHPVEALTAATRGAVRPRHRWRCCSAPRLYPERQAGPPTPWPPSNRSTPTCSASPPEPPAGGLRGRLDGRRHRGPPGRRGLRVASGGPPGRGS
jgi:hypothetical protein